MGDKTPTDSQYKQHLLLNDFTEDEANQVIKHIHNGLSLSDAKMKVKPVPTVDMSSGAKGFAGAQASGATGLTPEQEWMLWKQAHPVHAYAKERLMDKNFQEGAKAFVRPFTSGGADLLIPRNPRPLPSLEDAEKLSAAKMLQDYLKAQDMQRAHEHMKDITNRAAGNPGIIDYLMGSAGMPQAAPAPQFQIGQAQVAPLTLPPMGLKPNG